VNPRSHGLASVSGRRWWSTPSGSFTIATSPSAIQVGNALEELKSGDRAYRLTGVKNVLAHDVVRVRHVP
jgi:hypothetical protein